MILKVLNHCVCIKLPLSIKQQFKNEHSQLSYKGDATILEDSLHVQSHDFHLIATPGSSEFWLEVKY